MASFAAAASSLSIRTQCSWRSLPRPWSSSAAANDFASSTLEAMRRSSSVNRASVSRNDTDNEIKRSSHADVLAWTSLISVASRSSVSLRTASRPFAWVSFRSLIPLRSSAYSAFATAKVVRNSSNSCVMRSARLRRSKSIAFTTSSSLWIRAPMSTSMPPFAAANASSMAVLSWQTCSSMAWYNLPSSSAKLLRAAAIALWMEPQVASPAVTRTASSLS
mmetsp:Transcript_40513/g.80582  ORF Transcript_40513/g.80582 Transcript_40513/m.80582 type:complete len:220 (+) Transcript_40513:314-973(+)